MAAPSAAARAIGSAAKALGSGKSFLPVVGDALGAALGGARTNVNQSQATNVSLAVNPSIGVVVGDGSFSGPTSGTATGGASAPISADQSDGSGLPGGYGYQGYGSQGGSLYPSSGQGGTGGIFDMLLSNPILLIGGVGALAYFATQS